MALVIWDMDLKKLTRMKKKKRCLYKRVRENCDKKGKKEKIGRREGKQKMSKIINRNEEIECNQEGVLRGMSG